MVVSLVCQYPMPEVNAPYFGCPARGHYFHLCKKQCPGMRPGDTKVIVELQLDLLQGFWASKVTSGFSSIKEYICCTHAGISFPQAIYTHQSWAFYEC